MKRAEYLQAFYLIAIVIVCASCGGPSRALVSDPPPTPVPQPEATVLATEPTPLDPPAQSSDGDALRAVPPQPPAAPGPTALATPIPSSLRCASRSDCTLCSYPDTIRPRAGQSASCSCPDTGSACGGGTAMRSDQCDARMTRWNELCAGRIRCMDEMCDPTSGPQRDVGCIEGRCTLVWDR